MRRVNYLILVCLVSLLFYGCGKNYSGKYIYMYPEMEKFYKDKDGRIYNPNELAGFAFMLSGSRYQNYEPIYKYKIVKMILNVKHEKSNIEGNFVITDDKQLKEVMIKTGYVDKNKLLHLKLTNKMDSTVGVSVMGLSASTSLGDYLINLDEIKSDEKGIVKFKISGTLNILGGFFASMSSKEEIIAFEMFEQAYIEDNVNKFKEQLIKTDTDKLIKFIEEKDYLKASIIKSVVIDLGGTIDKVVLDKYEKVKDYYIRVKPELKKKAIKKAHDYYNKNLVEKTLSETTYKQYDTAIKYFEECLLHDLDRMDAVEMQKTISRLKYDKEIKRAVSLAGKKDFKKAISIAESAREKLGSNARYGMTNWAHVFKSQKNIVEYGDNIEFKYSVTNPESTMSGSRLYRMNYTIKNTGNKNIDRLEFKVICKDSKSGKEKDVEKRIYGLAPGKPEDGHITLDDNDISKKGFKTSYAILELNFDK